jgi:hypothetical protein
MSNKTLRRTSHCCRMYVHYVLRVTFGHRFHVVVYVSTTSLLLHFVTLNAVHQHLSYPTPQESGVVTMADLALQYNLGAELLGAAIGRRVGGAIRGKLEGGLIYTPAYIRRQELTTCCMSCC